MTVRLLCPLCLHDGRLQRLGYDAPPDWFACPSHGPMMTGRFVWVASGGKTTRQ
jgi:hypothetical protein